MRESSSATPAEAIAAYIGMDWADQKHDAILRSATEPSTTEHFQIAHEPEALMDWLGELQRRFDGKGKIAIALEQSRGALIYHLMGYEFLELYPIIGSISAHCAAVRSLGWGSSFIPPPILHAFSDRFLGVQLT